MDKVFRFKRMIAGVMALLVAFTFSMSGVRVDAAEKKGVTYIKEFKLYIDKDKDPAAAKDWFEKNDYTMIEGNLNEDASGALKSEVGVYLGFSTTTDVNEAVTDIAVMNERGNYSESEYKRILEDQKKMYTDMVSDMKTMLEEYRTNVKNNVPTAIQARDFMNGFSDDDSKEKLGDLLMTIDDEKLSTLLMQANGQIVLMIQERLSYACDTGKTTWLDRMVKLGSYNKLEKQALKACNNDITKARQLLDKKYKEDAMILSTNWEDIRQHITNIREKIKAYGLADKSEAEIKAFFEENEDNSEVNTFLGEYAVLSALERYPYEQNNLTYFFDQSSEEFKGDGIRKLYPLMASLSEGQVSAVDQSVSLFTLIMNALNAGAYNEYESGKTKELLDKADDAAEKELSDTKEDVDRGIKKFEEKNTISIYAGVDREIFKDGVAVTSTAQSFSNGDGVTWADVFVNSRVARGIAVGSAVASLGCLVGAIKVAGMATRFDKAIGERMFNRDAYYELQHADELDELCGISQHYARDFDKEGFNEGTDLLINPHDTFANQTDEVREFYRKQDEVINGDKIAAKMSFYRNLKIGLTVAGVLLAAADIIMTSITLYKYYNREHLPIPSYMVDLSYDDDEQSTFINYKSVTDQKNEYGDVNGGGGKQWLALYQTHDKDAGAPILAPDNGEKYKVIVQYGSADEPEVNGYSPLHLFGSPNAAQNLTYADGESGWSYNDGKNGTYVFFRRGNEAVADLEKEDEDADAVGGSAEDEAASDGTGSQAVSGSAVDAGTALGGGTVVLIGAGCGVAGIFIGLLLANIRRKKNPQQ